jgi:hypothetical protein
MMAEVWEIIHIINGEVGFNFAKSKALTYSSPTSDLIAVVF